jgi:DNA-binding NarL/FixJ family response regulator
LRGSPPESPNGSFYWETLRYRIQQVLSSFLDVTLHRREVTVSKCILIADDSGAVRTATRRSLESPPGLEVCGEAVDGLDALEKVRTLKPDLIILDLSMPRMNGLQAARELRAMMVRVPIVLFTLHADAVPPQVAAAAGISAVVSKMNLPALRQHIETLLVVS